MIQRIALFAASLVAALGVTVGLVIAGLGPQAAVAVPVVEPVAKPVVAMTDAPAPLVQVDTVYVAPAASPQEITVTKVVKAVGLGGENENEGQDD